MDHSPERIKTVVRIIGSYLDRHPELTRFPVLKKCSDISYEIRIDLEALDCIGNVATVEAYHRVDDLMQAWKLAGPLRPGSIHYMTVDIGSILPVINGSRVMFPNFSPYRGDIDDINRYFPADDAKSSTLALQSGDMKTVSGFIKDILIENTLQNEDIAMIQLAERDGYGLVVFPDLFNTYKNMMLREDCLEYTGIPQECHFSGDSSKTMIFVKSIKSNKRESH